MTWQERIGGLVDTLLDRSVLAGYPRSGFELRRRLPGWPADPEPGALRDRAAVVTGAGSGLGMATAAGLARLGARVYLVVRDTAKGERARAELADTVPGAQFRVLRCDVSDLEDVRRMAGELLDAEHAVDVVVHNAGVLPPTRSTSAQGHELALATHVLGPLRMTESLRPGLRAADSGRVILVSSGGMYTQSLPANDLEYTVGEYRGATAYARTKRIQVALAPMLARRWGPDRIAVHTMHPGWADTPGVADSLPGFRRLTGPILRNLQQGADTAVWLAATPEPLPSGRFWHDRRERPAHLLPWTRETEAERDAVWSWCAQAAALP
ncbi:SDR family NAD(P)-dependent oxidoreductase [Amycolatopsis aidingensis]|uniref:SDR family NAD(P)-dependent oxidoreductase n=1 Tax=Amycolatopsis aidingensis TaxID=2842453 RepID=UPI001C0A9927|nr:SDR family NAD(P)-dependent oxidoreductase [Amycolatopsis aidingensis]